MKKYLIPVAAGVVVFGAVTAFAASLTVNTKTLGAGNATVASCNDAANVSYNTSLPATTNDYIVTTTPVTTTGTGTGCAGMAYTVTLLGAGNTVLGTSPAGVLSGTGTASPDFTTQAILAKNVTGVAVVITG